MRTKDLGGQEREEAEELARKAEERPARKMRERPSQPSLAEVVDHEQAGHEPNRSWCWARVAGRAT